MPGLEVAVPESLGIEKSSSIARVDQRALRFQKWSRGSFNAFGWGLGILILGIALMAWNPSRTVLIVSGVLGFGMSALLALVSAGLGVAALTQLGSGPPQTKRAALLALFPVLTGFFYSLLGGVLALWAVSGFKRGRQLRTRSRVLLAPLTEGSQWSALTTGVTGVPAALQEVVAGLWRENGQTEHASVAAFARLTLDLVALGAPSRLIEQAQRDALDETRHAELCFSLARDLDGKESTPGPFPAAQAARTLSRRHRPTALAMLAVDSLVDGALHEGLSAAVIAQLAKRCEVEAIRKILRELAADEGRHAAHGWDVVEWCLQEGGEPVRKAIVAAALTLPLESLVIRAPSAADGQLEPFGIHGERLERAEYPKLRSSLLSRLRLTTSRGQSRISGQSPNLTDAQCD
jgi:hypothetical protein